MLESLGLSENQLSGKIPAELGNLTGLIWLYLQHNQLSGEIPSELGNLTKLNDVRLSHNPLTGLHTQGLDRGYKQRLVLV